MVHKMWSHNFRFSHLSLDHHTPEDFTRCMWQRCPRVAWWWLVYRTVFALYFLVTWFLALLEVGRPNVFDGTFFLYLTNWTYSLTMLMAVTAFIIVVIKTKQERRGDYVPENAMVFMPWYYKVYWAQQTICYTAAFCVSCIFWGAVYDPEIQPVDLINITTHLLNSVTMFIDFILVANPFRLLHMYLPAIYSSVYIVFNLFYFLCGGKDRKGSTAIYPIMDWQKPGWTALVCIICVCFLFFVSLLFFSLHRLKKWIKNRRRAAQHEVTTNKKEGKENLGLEAVIV